MRDQHENISGDVQGADDRKKSGAHEAGVSLLKVTEKNGGKKGGRDYKYAAASRPKIWE